MKGTREVFTAEQLYEELRPRLSLSDAWLAKHHPELLQRADAMVEALQKKESYHGGVAQRAAHLAAHLKNTDPWLSFWLERQAAAAAAKAAAAAASAPPAAEGAAPSPASEAAPAAIAADATGAGGGGGSSGAGTCCPLASSATVNGGGSAPADANLKAEAARVDGRGEGGAAAAGTGVAETPAKGSGDASKGTPAKGAKRKNGEVAGDADAEGEEKREKGSSSKGGAATALEYLTTTFAHLREQRTLVMGDKKDRLLKEIAGLRQMRAGHINVLRGANSSETSMGDMLAALKAADNDYHDDPPAAGATPDATPGADAGDAPAAADGEAKGPTANGSQRPAGRSAAAAGKGNGKNGSGSGSEGSGRGALDNLTCVVWEDWRVPERLATLLRAGDTVLVYVEVHCRDGPEDTRLAMRLSTFVALALCSQRLIADLYQDMFIAPQRIAASRPQRKRQRTAAEETVQTLDESPDSLDFVDFVEALHRRMPLRCGWMYANAIMPTAGEWDRVFGREAGRLSGLFEGGPELDALGRASLAFHHTRHESPVLDVHVLASQLRQQLQRRQQEEKLQQAQAQQDPAQVQQQAEKPAQAQQGEQDHHHHHHHAAGGQACSACRGTSAVPCSSNCGGHDGDGSRDGDGGEGEKPPRSLLVRPPGNSTGGDKGLDLGHLSFCCVTAAPLADDFLGELIRQTTAGQAAAEVAAAAAVAAAIKAAKCNGKLCGGACVVDAAEAAEAAATAAAKLAMFPLGGPTEVGGWAPVDEEGVDEEEEEELFGVVQEELMAVEAAAVAAEREAAEAVVGAGGAAAGGGGLSVKAEPGVGAARVAAAPMPSGAAEAERPAGRSGQHLKGAFNHRMQLMPGVFFSYFIGSQAFTNTAWHVEDFLLQSINLMLVGRPKAWWWVPRNKEAAFLEYLDEHWEKEDVYTKSVPLASVPLEKLAKMGIRRSVQLPGAIFITSPGYAFHTTMSSGWSMADSANFMTNILGKDMHVLEDERPLEQYPDTEGLASTGEWVRFTMRRIEELRAANDPAYVPRSLQRLRKEAVARQAAAASSRVKSEGSGSGLGPRKMAKQETADDHLGRAPSAPLRARGKATPKAVDPGGEDPSPGDQPKAKQQKQVGKQPPAQPKKEQQQARPKQEEKAGGQGGDDQGKPRQRVRDRTKERERQRERRRKEAEARQRAIQAQQANYAAAAASGAAERPPSPPPPAARQPPQQHHSMDPRDSAVAAERAGSLPADPATRVFVAAAPPPAAGAGAGAGPVIAPSLSAPLPKEAVREAAAPPVARRISLPLVIGKGSGGSVSGSLPVSVVPGSQGAAVGAVGEQLRAAPAEARVGLIRLGKGTRLRIKMPEMRPEQRSTASGQQPQQQQQPQPQQQLEAIPEARPASRPEVRPPEVTLELRPETQREEEAGLLAATRPEAQPEVRLERGSGVVADGARLEAAWAEGPPRPFPSPGHTHPAAGAWSDGPKDAPARSAPGSLEAAAVKTVEVVNLADDDDDGDEGAGRGREAGPLRHLQQQREQQAGQRELPVRQEHSQPVLPQQLSQEQAFEEYLVQQRLMQRLAQSHEGQQQQPSHEGQQQQPSHEGQQQQQQHRELQEQQQQPPDEHAGSRLQSRARVALQSVLGAAHHLPLRQQQQQQQPQVVKQEPKQELVLGLQHLQLPRFTRQSSPEAHGPQGATPQLLLPPQLPQQQQQEDGHQPHHHQQHYQQQQNPLLGRGVLLRDRLVWQAQPQPVADAAYARSDEETEEDRMLARQEAALRQLRREDLTWQLAVLSGHGGGSEQDHPPRRAPQLSVAGAHLRRTPLAVLRDTVDSRDQPVVLVHHRPHQQQQQQIQVTLHGLHGNQQSGQHQQQRRHNHSHHAQQSVTLSHHTVHQQQHHHHHRHYHPYNTISHHHHQHSQSQHHGYGSQQQQQPVHLVRHQQYDMGDEEYVSLRLPLRQDQQPQQQPQAEPLTLPPAPQPQLLLQPLRAQPPPVQLVQPSAQQPAVHSNVQFPIVVQQHPQPAPQPQQPQQHPQQQPTILLILPQPDPVLQQQQQPVQLMPAPPPQPAPIIMPSQQLLQLQYQQHHQQHHPHQDLLFIPDHICPDKPDGDMTAVGGVVPMELQWRVAVA